MKTESVANSPAHTDAAETCPLGMTPDENGLTVCSAGTCAKCQVLRAASSHTSASNDGAVHYVAHFAMDGTPLNAAAEKVLAVRDRASASNVCGDASGDKS